MPIPAKRYFLNEDDIIYLADYLLMYPCNAYLHLCHAIMHKRLKTYIIDENTNAPKEGKISIYSFPVQHMMHEDICAHFSTIVFKKENIDKFKDDIEQWSILTEERIATHDFCAPDNIGKIAPQIAFMLHKYASKRTTDKFDEHEARECFYAKKIVRWDAVTSYTPRNRLEWCLPHSTLWPIELSFSAGVFPIDFMLNVTLPQFRDALIRGGTRDPKKLAQLIDERFPGLLTDHKIGELVRPKESKNIKYGSVRQYGRDVRGKQKQ